jgi:broad specificity phosphatase PhoE
MGLHFLRHGESTANISKTFAGQLNSPLTEVGRNQAEKESERLADEQVYFDVILSSPLSRAWDTAVIIATELGYPVREIIAEELILERGGGRGEGMALEDFFALSEEEQIGMGAESFRSLSVRAFELLAKIENEYPSQDILLVSHATFGEMLQAILKYNDYTRVLDGEKIPNARTIRLK